MVPGVGQFQGRLQTGDTATDLEEPEAVFAAEEDLELGIGAEPVLDEVFLRLGELSTGGGSP